MQELINKVEKYLQDLPQLTTWYFPGAKPGELGTPEVNSDGYFEVYIEFKGLNDPVLITLNRMYI